MPLACNNITSEAKADYFEFKAPGLQNEATKKHIQINKQTNEKTPNLGKDKASLEGTGYNAERVLQWH